jgi:hypothetical protein
MNLYLSHNLENVCIKPIRNEENSPEIGWIVLGLEHAVYIHTEMISFRKTMIKNTFQIYIPWGGGGATVLLPKMA